jgi:predicted RNA-binding protein
MWIKKQCARIKRTESILIVVPQVTSSLLFDFTNSFVRNNFKVKPNEKYSTRTKYGEMIVDNRWAGWSIA